MALMLQTQISSRAAVTNPVRSQLASTSLVFPVFRMCYAGKKRRKEAEQQEEADQEEGEEKKRTERNID